VIDPWRDSWISWFEPETRHLKPYFFSAISTNRLDAQFLGEADEFSSQQSAAVFP
jgi:hypothetical protein